jgi:hypothetical protein
MKTGTVPLYLRIPPWLHEAIQKAAESREQKMTEYCTQILMKKHAQDESTAQSSNRESHSLEQHGPSDRHPGPSSVRSG